MTQGIEINYLIPKDDEEDSPAITLSIDKDSDVLISQDGIRIMPSYAQASTLHQSLGQMLIRHRRSWGAKPSKLYAVT